MDILFQCKICSNQEQNKIFLFEENMFATKEKFEYLECGLCKCIQLRNLPEDISKFYPDEYSNYKSAVYKKGNVIINYLRRIKAGIMLDRRKYNIPGLMLRRFYPDDFVSKLSPARLNLNSKILDLGAGNGERILRLSERGFTSVFGIDPYIKTDLHLARNVQVLRMDIFQINELYDFIMLNHSFEHMSNPQEILKKLNKLIPVEKYVMIRIPVAGSYAWFHYRHNWVALDPPRHFFLHTKQSIKILAEESGFKLDHVLFDSMEYQFIGSEQLKKGIKRNDPNSYYMNKKASIFSGRDVKKFKRQARKLNKKGMGDAACFYLKKTEDVSDL
jgi:SAM-dependent methyltransferase